MTHQTTKTVTAQRRNIALWALCLTQIVGFGALYYALPVALTDIAHDTGLSTELIMGIFSGSLVITALLGIPVGRLLDRFGSKVAMTTGSFLGAFALVLVGFSTSLEWFITAWVLIGIAGSLTLYSAAFAAIARWFQPNPVPAMTLVTLFGGLASTIFAPLVSLLISEYGWQHTFIILGVIFAVTTIPAHGLALLGNKHFRVAETTHSSPIPLPESAAEQRSIWRIIGSSTFLAITASLTVSSFGLYAANLTLIQLFEEKHYSLFIGSIALGIFGAGQIAGRFVYPKLSTKLSPGKQLSTSMSIAAILMVVVAVVATPLWLLIACIIVIGAVRGLATLIQANIVRELWPLRLYGTLSGIMAAPITTSMAISPWLGTLIAQHTGSYLNAHLILACLTGFGVLLAVLAGRTPNRNQSL